MAQNPIAMEQLKQIIQLQNDGVSIREITRRLGISRNSVRKYLSRRCLAARKESKNAPKVIGIAIGKSQTNEHKFDIAYFDIPELNEEVLKKIEEAKQELGYFKNPTIRHSKDMRT